MIFKDRVHAGFLLSEKLFSYRDSSSLVIGLSRGGMVVASEVAKNLKLLLDVLVVKKISVPDNSELALGAVAPDGVTVIDRQLAARTGASQSYIKSQISNLNDKIQEKSLLYRKRKKQLSVTGKTVILVDDGAATGATAEVAVKWLRKKKAGQIIVALTVAPADVTNRLQQIADELVILDTPADFSAVGQFYEEFGQVSDEEVVELLL